MKSTKFKLRGFREPREAVRHAALGKLEREVMEELWRRGRASVRDMEKAFGERVAYTTLMTTLDRLYRKKLLSRRKESYAFIYTARFSREEFEQTVAKEVLDGLLEDNAEPLLLHFVEAVSERDRRLLDELDRIVQEKRRNLRKQK
ncbi:MAG: BlaI/MecI/CopY family transcriptional regulator [Blastocatellia bacterium]|nr:BlaI/MecI/CopY family transcriptional regulator [Blastocatellia bacterium]